jgi:hypothetical protein
LRPTVSRPVRLGIGPPYGILDQILSCLAAGPSCGPEKGVACQDYGSSYGGPKKGSSCLVGQDEDVLEDGLVGVSPQCFLVFRIPDDGQSPETQ